MEYEWPGADGNRCEGCRFVWLCDDDGGMEYGRMSEEGVRGGAHVPAGCLFVAESRDA